MTTPKNAPTPTSSTSRPKLRVVIIGGSLSALFTAITLKRLPSTQSITILEKHSPQRLQDQGAGIRLGAEFVHAVQQYTGVAPGAYTVALKGYRVVNRQNKVKLDAPAVAWASSWGQIFGVLNRVFAETRRGECECEYWNGCRVDRVEENGEGVEVGYVDAEGRDRRLEAELVIAADGASSVVRQIVAPEAKRSYVGYVIQRGTVPVEELSEETMEMMGQVGFFEWTHDSQFISYTIPDNDDYTRKRKMLMNWGWYEWKTVEELEILMTGTDGKRYEYSLPAGVMKQEEAEKIYARAQKDLSATNAEVVAATKQPFVQVITDNIAGENASMGGKLLLVGDAVGGQRPHTASAATQAAFHALMVRELLEGRIDLQQWANVTQEYSRKLVETGRELGVLCMTEDTPTDERAAKHLKMLRGTYIELDETWKKFLGDYSVKL